MPEKKNRNKRWAYLIGIGLALCPIHNTWITKLVTTDGSVGFFLPAFGTAIWLMGSLMFVTWNWNQIKAVGLGAKSIWIPLLAIVGAIGLSGAFTGTTIQDKLSPLLMGCAMFSVYLTVRVIGRDVLYPLVIGAVIASLGVIAYAIIYPHVLSGGFVFEGNYDIIVGYVLVALAMFIHKYRWLLSGLALVALFLTGSPEAVFVVAIIAVAVLIRRDWSRKLLYVIIPTGILAVILLTTGYLQSFYSYTIDVAKDSPVISANADDSYGIGQRLRIINQSFDNFSAFGDGYNVTNFQTKTVHNVPLIIVQQLGIPGIIAALAWLWVSFYCLFKTKWKYLWIIIIALSVFDHFIWTQLSPWWWVALGVTTNSSIGNDLIFKTKEV
jgi:hypothetical protein